MAKVRGALAASGGRAALTGRSRPLRAGALFCVFMLILRRYSLFRAMAASGCCSTVIRLP
ncbi:hypothetical protein TUM17576_55840 [Enterobacter hormaechei]|nr:hypothetical protein TUM17576_55840 [Enterobacter hormaechei]GJL43423.1 hypothetical protein TUM17577_46320 [Enterobacter asburiae]